MILGLAKESTDNSLHDYNDEYFLLDDQITTLRWVMPCKIK